MKKLIDQILKFGLVGVICFFVDFGIYTLLNVVFRAMGMDESFPQYYLISQFFSFLVSMILNYILSMKFVFERRDDISKKKEFVIFFILSVIGLVINEIVLYLGMGVIYAGWAWLQSWMSNTMAETFFKLAATGVVMVYNFISRKMVLEKKD